MDKNAFPGSFKSFCLTGLLIVLGTTTLAQAQPGSGKVASPWGSQGMPTVNASQPAPKPKLPKELKEVEAKYAKAGSIEAQFEQITESATMKQKKRSSGVIQIKIPDKLRWETTAPDKSLLVSDGKRFWFYTPPFDEEDEGQLIERKGSDVRSKMASALMSAAFSRAQRRHGLKIIKRDQSHYTLIPRKGSAGTVVEAKIEIDLVEKIIKKVILFHKDGNVAEINLIKVDLGKPMEDSLFVFTPPPRTEITKE
jgi:outer membrane lipoprotein carrier protein